MRKLIPTFFGGLLCWASAALAVSQVGGGKIYDVHQGYSTPFPRDFAQSYVENSVGIQLRKAFSFGNGLPGGFGQIQTLNIYDLATELAAVAQIDNKDQFANYWLKLGWSRGPSNDDCIVLFTKENTSTYNVVLAWGAEKGIQLTGQKTPDVASAIRELTDGIRLEPGACSWK